jgi:mono/diheme cytochrome c family protein
MKKPLALALLLAAGCELSLPGKPDPALRKKLPGEVMDFDDLYSRHCAGCHGKDGTLGPAPPLNDALFLAIIPEAALRQVIRTGRPGTPMPAFAHARGGTLTDQQVEALVKGLKARWADAKASAQGVPSYRPPPGIAGDPRQGAKVFARACAGCHGDDGQGGSHGAINQPAFLGLISDQALRRLVITGRADLGMPDYAGKDGRAPDYRPLTDVDVTHLTALLARWRQSSSEDGKP